MENRFARAHEKRPVRVGGTRAFFYLSLAPSEIVCESDLQPEIGVFIRPGGGGKISLFKPTYSRSVNFKFQRSRLLLFSSLRFVLYHGPQSHRLMMLL
jgi:hypothetical protein